MIKYNPYKRLPSGTREIDLSVEFIKCTCTNGYNLVMEYVNIPCKICLGSFGEWVKIDYNKLPKLELKYETK